MIRRLLCLVFGHVWGVRWAEPTRTLTCADCGAVRSITTERNHP